MAKNEAENMQNTQKINEIQMIEKELDEANKNPKKYKNDYDTLPMPKKHFNWIK
jgi:hypothetical protein